MNYKIFSPSCELENIVKKYVVFNSLDNIEKLLFLPDGGSFIVFNRGINVGAKLYGVDDIFNIPATYSTNFKTNRVKQLYLDLEYNHNDDLFPIIIVELLPIGLYKLFNVDMSAMNFKYQEIEKDIVDKYFSKVYTNTTIEKELESLDKDIVELNNSQNNSHLPIEDVVNKIYNHYNLDVTVEDLLEEFDFSRSTLERNFKKMIGLTPKNFIYITKFTKTLLEYIDEKRTFHELQYIYSDNSHMNVVFQKFLGIAPSEILKKVIDGEIAIYQLLNLDIDKPTVAKDNNIICPSEIKKYSKNINVLYVEDDEILRKAMSKLFKNYFDSLDIAEDGEEGLKKYLDNHNTSKAYDLLITDINMPKMDGIKMSKEILKVNPSQIIMITSAHCEFITTVKEMGIRAVLTKPINNNDLSNHLYQILKEIYDNRLV